MSWLVDWLKEHPEDVVRMGWWARSVPQEYLLIGLMYSVGLALGAVYTIHQTWMGE